MQTDRSSLIQEKRDCLPVRNIIRLFLCYLNKWTSRLGVKATDMINTWWSKLKRGPRADDMELVASYGAHSIIRPHPIFSLFEFTAYLGLLPAFLSLRQYFYCRQ